MARNDPHFRLRIPAGLKFEIEQKAEINGRSINAEIVDRLVQSLVQPTGSPLLAGVHSELAKLVRHVESVQHYANIIEDFARKLAESFPDEKDRKEYYAILDYMRKRSVLAKRDADVEAPDTKSQTSADPE